MLNIELLKLKNKMIQVIKYITGMVQPYFIGRNYNVGEEAVSKDIKYTCIKAHTSSPDKFIGNPKYWKCDYKTIKEPVKEPEENKKPEDTKEKPKTCKGGNKKCTNTQK